MIINWDELNKTLVTIVTHYEKSSPITSQWADDLYMRLQENPRTIKLDEIITVSQLTVDGLIAPNYAQNLVYHMLERLGQAEGVLDH